MTVLNLLIMRRIKMGNELFKYMLGYDPFEITRNNTYPPHNVFQAGNQWKIEIACAGFKRNELDVTTNNSELTITGEKTEEQKTEKANVIWKGIGTRSFKKSFILEPNQKVIGADYEDGILSVIVEKQKDKENVNRITIS